MQNKKCHIYLIFFVIFLAIFSWWIARTLVFVVYSPKRWQKTRKMTLSSCRNKWNAPILPLWVFAHPAPSRTLSSKREWAKHSCLALARVCSSTQCNFEHRSALKSVKNVLTEPIGCHNLTGRRIIAARTMVIKSPVEQFITAVTHIFCSPPCLRKFYCVIITTLVPLVLKI